MLEHAIFAAINVACFVGTGLLLRLIEPLFDMWFSRKKGRPRP